MPNRDVSVPKNHYHLLVVDDDTQLLQTVAAGLRQQGYEVDVAATVEEARQSCSRAAMDLVVTDLKLIRESGLDLVLWLKQHRPGVPVLLISGKGTLEEAIDAINLEVDGYIRKPLAMETLYLRVRELIARRECLKEKQCLQEGMEHYARLQEDLNRARNFEECFRGTFHGFRKIVPYHRMALIRYYADSDSFVGEYAMSDESQALLRNFPLLGGEAELRQHIHRHAMLLVGDLEPYAAQHPESRFAPPLLASGVRSLLGLPLYAHAQGIGFLCFESWQRKSFRPGHLLLLERVGSLFAASYEKWVLLREMASAIASGFSSLAEKKDLETGLHLKRITLYAALLANRLLEEGLFPGLLDPSFCRAIETFIPLHDIGKVGIPDAILCKAGKLTQEEFEVMKGHTLIGGDVLREAQQRIRMLGNNFFQFGINIAECHHERFDGTGYPHGWKGDRIPLEARLAAVVDVFDALTSRRFYKEAWPFDRSMSKIVAGGGAQFDPLVAQTFARHHEAVREIYQQYLEV